MLAYVATIIAIITLAPFRFLSAPQHGLTSEWSVFDLVMNVVMFVPLGFLFQLTREEGDPAPWWQALLMGAGLSAAIETAQLFEVSRFSSLMDVATNAAGALVGAGLHRLAVRRVNATAAVRSLALELPLMGLVYLLVPLAWLAGLASDGSHRAWFLLPLSAVAGGIMGTVHAAYLDPIRPVARGWLLLASALWFGTALLPTGVKDPALIVAGLTVAVGVSWLRSISTARYRRRHANDASNRRFELPTLRLVLPFFALYLALSSLWPLDAAVPAWYGGFALLPPWSVTNNVNLFVALEHVAAFTLVGYIIAEFRGRALLPYRHMVGRVVRWGGGLSLLFEATRGFHPLYGASAMMLGLTVAASAFGGWLYHLQRDYVRARVAAR